MGPHLFGRLNGDSPNVLVVQKSPNGDSPNVIGSPNGNSSNANTPLGYIPGMDPLVLIITC